MRAKLATGSTTKKVVLSSCFLKLVTTEYSQYDENKPTFSVGSFYKFKRKYDP